MHHTMKYMAASAAGALLLAAAPASAQANDAIVVTGDSEVLRATISYSDLNLASPAGRTRLEQRVQKAARQVCPSDGSMKQLLNAMECKQAARAGAAMQIEKIAGQRS
jgi:UrcA family protein